MARSNPDALNAPFRKKKEQAKETKKVRMCDHPDCQEEGDYRAPRNRDNLSEFYWFCLKHVQEHNKSWNYFSGMSDHQMEDSLRADMTWQRPTWKMGDNASAKRNSGQTRVKDSFGIWTEKFREAINEDYVEPVTPLTPQLRKALSLFDLAAPVTVDEVRTKYRVLVKKYHPDANGGDPKMEEKMKQVTQAYSLLKKGIN